MYNPEKLSFCLPLLLSALLVGCGGSSDSSDSSSANVSYLQFYNASANSSSATLLLQSSSLNTISYNDASTSYNIESTSLVEVSGPNSAGTTTTLFSQTLNSDVDDRHFLVMTGDYTAPEFVDFVYQDSELESGEMTVFASHFAYYSAEQSYDIYLGQADGSFETAQMIDSVNYKTISAANILSTDNYLVYLTEPGQSTPIFTSTEIPLTSETSYILAIKDTFGPGEVNLAVDVITHFTTVSQYSDDTADAEFRVFNGLPDNQVIDVSASSSVTEINSNDVQPNQTSEFYQVGFDDYGFIVTADSGETLLNNLLISLAQDDSSTVLIYQNEVGEVQGMSYQQDKRPRAFESQVTLANLSFGYDEVEVYFLRPGETIDTAEYKIENLIFEEINSIDLPTDDYEVVVVNQDANGTLTLVYQSQLMNVNNDSGYSMVLSNDSNAALGHRLAVLP